MTSQRTLWRNRSFLLLFGAQGISLLGSGATTIGLALFARQLVGSASATAVVGNALTLRIVAFLLFSQLAGVLADRVSRKALLIASDVIRAGLLLLVPFATSAGHVYLLIFAINAVTAFFTPTYEASVPAIAGEAHIVQALLCFAGHRGPRSGRRTRHRWRDCRPDRCPLGLLV
jgi:NRE family putative nickel resistance protein-like MFS transporter